MSQWGFFFNQDRCVGCKACVVACKNWNEDRRGDAKITPLDAAMNNFVVPDEGFGDYIAPVGGLDPNVYTDETGANNFKLSRQFYMKENWRRVDPIEDGSVTVNPNGTFEINAELRYISMSCNHCTNAACVKACPMGNIYKDKDTGATLVGNNCISCGRCKSACPWDAPQFYDVDYAKYSSSDPKRPFMTKCNLCIDRINEGRKPACVAACWNRALDAGPMEELEQKYISNPFRYTLKRTLAPEFVDISTEPNIIFNEKVIKKP